MCSVYTVSRVIWFKCYHQNIGQFLIEQNPTAMSQFVHTTTKRYYSNWTLKSGKIYSKIETEINSTYMSYHTNFVSFECNRCSHASREHHWNELNMKKKTNENVGANLFITALYIHYAFSFHICPSLDHMHVCCMHADLFRLFSFFCLVHFCGVFGLLPCVRTDKRLLINNNISLPNEYMGNKRAGRIAPFSVTLANQFERNEKKEALGNTGNLPSPL